MKFVLDSVPGDDHYYCSYLCDRQCVDYFSSEIFIMLSTSSFAISGLRNIHTWKPQVENAEFMSMDFHVAAYNISVEMIEGL